MNSKQRRKNARKHKEAMAVWIAEYALTWGPVPRAYVLAWRGRIHNGRAAPLHHWVTVI